MFKLAFLCNIDSEKLLRQHIALPKGTLVSLIQRLLYLAEYLLLATEVISDFLSYHTNPQVPWKCCYYVQ